MVGEKSELRDEVWSRMEEGIFACPEGAATVAGAKKLREENKLGPEEEVLLYNTGSGLKYIDTFTENLDMDISVIESVDEIEVE